MSSFTTELRVHPNSDGRTWTLDEAFGFYIDSNDATSMTINVPAGFVTDFASIPQLFWNILPPWGTYGKAAVVHDYLYGRQGVLTEMSPPWKYTRKQADEILLEGMKVLGVNWCTRWIIYTAVRNFGGWAWEARSKK
jgi:hypothetical protein